ncbi:PucR family transcriptional regulator [Nocardia sp. NPDC057227]|uniref:PucR family transcriptional regulator n=1 Tax=Nocardia sp. NPDC057227 TaxID=3346056 RepID=UPI0036455449
MARQQDPHAPAGTTDSQVSALIDLVVTKLGIGIRPGTGPDAADDERRRRQWAVLHRQLTRPGPARAHLAAMLDPLDAHPELLQTLRVHFRNESNRKRTARELYVHPNTVDYRLRRIARLTGHDPVTGGGAWRLRSALTARDAERPGETSTYRPQPKPR